MRIGRRGAARLVVMCALLVGLVGCGRFGYAETRSDAGFDAGFDAGIDTGFDAGIDLGPTDAGVDFGTPTGPDNVVFTTDTPVAADITYAGADAHCLSVAQDAGLVGTFVALLGPGTTSSAKLGDARGFVRPDGRLVAYTVADLETALVHPPLLDARGRALANSTIWTGYEQDCLGFTSVVPTDRGSTGTVDDVTRGRYFGDPSSASGASCSMSLRLLCVQTDHRTTPNVTLPAPGRRVFVSDLGGDPDATCEASRVRAGLANPFRALVATTTVSALARIGGDPLDLRRMDGHALFRDLMEVAASNPTIPVRLDATGAPLPFAPVVTGAARLDLLAAPGGDCTGYTVVDGSQSTVGGYSTRAGPLAFGGGPNVCDGQRRYYCVESP